MMCHTRSLLPAMLLGLSGLLLATSLPAQDAADAQAQIRQLQELVRQQGERLAALETALAIQQKTMETMAKEQQTVAAAVAAPQKSPVVVALGKGTDQLKITGDLRLRYETQSHDTSSGDSAQSRFMPRLRVGLVWTSPDWEVGAGIATGGDKATSTNDTWGDTSPFQSDDLRLDYAYAKRSWGDFALTLGQQKNPFLGTWAVWDADVRPTGATGQYRHGPWFATAGAYDVRYYGADEDSAYLGALQLGAQGKHDKLSGKVALSWYQFNRATVDPNNTAKQPTPQIANEDYNLTLGSLYGEGTYQGKGWSGTVFGEYTRNFAADGPTGQVTGCDPEANDTAWALGARIAVRKVGIEYTYAHIESDAVYSQLNDATFGSPLGTTDVEGHVVTLSYALTERLKLSAQAYLTNPIVRTSPDDGQLYLVDATWKF